MSTTRKIKSPSRFMVDVMTEMGRRQMSHGSMAQAIAGERDSSYLAGEQLWRRARDNPDSIKLGLALTIARVLNLDIYYTEEK